VIAYRPILRLLEFVLARKPETMNYLEPNDVPKSNKRHRMVQRTTPYKNLTCCGGGKYYSARFIFIASLLLVLSAGGFSRSSLNDSCRSYSEALATTFYSQGPTRSQVTWIKRGFIRGGSSSTIFSSCKEETEDDVPLENVLVSNNNHKNNNSSNTNCNVTSNKSGVMNKSHVSSSSSSSSSSTTSSCTSTSVSTTSVTASSSSSLTTGQVQAVPTNISIQKNGFGKVGKKFTGRNVLNNHGASLPQIVANGKSKLVVGGDRLVEDYSMQVFDQHILTKHVAETNLPTDIGHFRLRAYRVEEQMQELLQNEYFGTEPCVIYATDKPPFGKESVPVRIHDQCFTSEVFRSQR